MLLSGHLRFAERGEGGKKRAFVWREGRLVKVVGIGIQRKEKTHVYHSMYACRLPELPPTVTGPCLNIVSIQSLP
jgi:hypothetical protein